MSRRYSVFSRAPLTYESLRARRTDFHGRKTHCARDLQDYIAANRKLQRINQGLDPRLRHGTLGIDLGLTLNVPSTQLEDELWVFVRKYWAQCVASDAVVQTYVTTARSGDMVRLFHLVRENFSCNLGNGAVSLGPVTALVHVLLKSNDFHGCVRLVDDTVSSAKLLAVRRRQLVQGAVRAGVASACVSALGALSYAIFGASCHGWELSPMLDHALALWPIVPLSVGSTLCTFFGLKWVKTAALPRVSWRPHTSVYHRLLHSDEALLVNKIVTYFEEYNEVNVKNFHISEVRPRPKLDVLERPDYELHLPETGVALADEKATETDALTRYFRTQLHGRKMVWNPLKEEKMFLDFWVNHGDCYEWVEPDQDPAEIKILRQPRDILGIRGA